MNLALTFDIMSSPFCPGVFTRTVRGLLLLDPCLEDI